MTSKREMITLTFSRRNRDVLSFLKEKKAANADFVVTDYLCDAVRFYEENQGMDRESLRELITAEIRQIAGLSGDPTSQWRFFPKSETAEPETTDTVRFLKDDSTIDDLNDITLDED